ncbi:MAG: hypothetical protein WCO11_00400 [Sphingomonadales bacterium]|jgi:hypothetical protein
MAPADPADGVDFDTAAADPAAFYDTPDAVLADPQLTSGQRRRFLLEWASDIQRRQQSLSEGMGASAAPSTGQDAEWERRIFTLLAQLPDAPDDAPPVSRMWRHRGGDPATT